jgi:hypothetical protein
MPARDLDAVFFVSDCPEIAFRDGLFHIGYDIGKNARFEVVLSPSTYLKALRCANELAAKWQVEQLDKVAAIR